MISYYYSKELPAASPLQQMDYQYNIRGWMTKINDPANLNGKLFGYKIKYTDPVNPLYATARYNGNIAEIDWSTSNDNILKRYTYDYYTDNKLKFGHYSEPWTTVPQNSFYSEYIIYDLNGNISQLYRNGKNPSTGTAMQIDNLEYTYIGNRLQKITDITQNNAGYEGGGNSIDYDLNGSMINMKDKGIQTITYNHLNLPKAFVINHVDTIFGSSSIANLEYLYRADGTKLRKTYSSAPPRGLTRTKITDYLDGFQYSYYEGGGICLECRTEFAFEEQAYGNLSRTLPNLGDPPAWKLDFVPTAEGFYSFTENRYIYQYKDHLGNVRVSFVKNSAGVLEIKDTNNYYPFGLNHISGINVGSNFGGLYSYKYNGKELQETGMYDYGARFYMADLGRWGVVDPLSEKFFDFSNYNYVLNNPIKFIDKDGMDVYIMDENGKIILAKKEDKNDIVFGYNSKTGNLNDNNGDKKIDDSDGQTVKTKGLIGQLQYYRDGNKKDKYPAYHQAIKEYSSQVEEDMFNLFQYAANNAKNVEFSLIDFNLGKKRYLALQTYNDSGFSPGSGQIGKDVSTNAEYHNHPFKTKYEEDYTEINSMGSRGNGIYYGAGGDYRNTVDYNVNYPNYVFFPKSTNLYNVTKTGIYLIKKINNESKNFKK